MFEDQTHEVILQRMLAQVPDGVDKRQGSIIYDALAPAAAELVKAYGEVERALNMASGLTATGQQLDLRTMDYGVTRKTATPAVFRGVFVGAEGVPLSVPIGSRYGASVFFFTAEAMLSPGQYRLRAEAVGEGPNSEIGTLQPLDYVPGLASAELVELLIPGTGQESDGDLRKRYLAGQRSPATSGNIAHYVEWANEVPGVGGVRVQALWDGPGTIKVILLDADRLPASTALVSDVQTYIDPVPGKGEGQAPVGATVTVVAAAAKTINVTATVVLAAGYSLQSAIDTFTERLDAWRREAAFTATYVSYPAIGALLLGTPGVVDYSALKLNGGTVNIPLAAHEVPVIGTVDLEV